MAALLFAEERAPEPAAAGSKTYHKAALIHFDGEITPWLQGYFNRKLAAAKKAGADLIVIELDSPGGYMQESGDMADLLRETKWAHTVAYVPDEALSGAAYVSLGCDEIVMRPSARLGDVGVIFLDQDFMFRYAPEKIRSNLVQELRILAEAKGRPPALAEAMVDMDVEVFRCRNRSSGEIAFHSEAELKTRPDSADWEQLELVLESQKGRFLEVSGTRAVELKLASAVVSGQEELRSRYKVDGSWEEYRPDAVDKAVYILGLWWVTGLLFVIGLVGLLYELCAPGTCIGGITALLCFALFYWSRFLSGTSGLLELTLFAAGVLFLAVEIFVLPGFGVSGVAGIILIVVSLILACQSFIIPETAHDWKTLLSSTFLVLGSCVVFCVVAAVMTRYFHNIPILNRMILAPPAADKEAADNKASAGDKGGKASEPAIAIGSVGRAESPLRPIGRARFGNTFLDVVCEGDYIPKGAPLRVIEVAGHRIVVEAADVKPT